MSGAANTSRSFRNELVHLAGLLPAPRIARLCILTTGRAGSELLVGLLDGHPHMRCEGELLAIPRREPFRFLRGRTRVAWLQRLGAYAFKINAQNLALTSRRWTLPTYVRALIDDGFRIVRLRRTNLLRQALSTMRAGQTQTFHVREAMRAGALRIDPIEVIHVMRRFESRDEYLDDLLRNDDTLELTYEDDIECDDRRADTLARVFTLAGLEPVAALASPLRQTTPRRFADAVENHDEIRSLITGTRYERYLFD